MTKEKSKNLFFQKKFLIQLKDWKNARKSEGKDFSDQAFADEVGVSRGSVANWKKGVLPDSYSLEEICRVFGVKKEYFQINSREDMYQFSQEYITDVGRENAQFAEEIGFDMGLLSALRRLVDFEKLFPIYSNILPTLGRLDSCITAFRNPNLANSETIQNEELKDLQIERDGKLITLHKNDLKFLKDVQDEVVRYVEYLFYKRSEEMEEEIIDISRACHRIGEDKHIPSREEFKLMQEDPAKVTEVVYFKSVDFYKIVASIDKYGEYLDPKKVPLQSEEKKQRIQEEEGEEV